MASFADYLTSYSTALTAFDPAALGRASTDTYTVGERVYVLSYDGDKTVTITYGGDLLDQTAFDALPSEEQTAILADLATGLGSLAP